MNGRKLSNFKYDTYLMIGSFLLFLLIAFLSMNNMLATFDQAIISWFTDNTSATIMTIMQTVSKIGSSEIILILTFVIGIYFLVKKMWRHSIFVVFLMFGGIVFNFILKVLFQRERPGEMSVIEAFGYSLEIPSYSFPSGHTMRSMMLFAFLIYMCVLLFKNSRIKLLCVVLLSIMIACVAVSRIVVGAHFPSDVIAAGTVSIAWFYFCLKIFRLGKE